MDWSTVVLSAGVSAVVGTVVSLVAVSQVTVRRARAERREESRVELASVVQPLVQKLARYRFATSRQAAQRETQDVVLADLGDVYRISNAAAGLSAVTRWRISRRLRRIYGGWMVDLATDYPQPAGQPGEAAFRAWLASAMSKDEVDDRHAPAQSLMHRTYSRPPSRGGGKALARELALLAKGR